jgi:Rrf2 family protein
MHLTTKGQYGTRAMLDLSLHYRQGPQTIDAIAARQEIPKKYLEQVMLLLKSALLVSSVRGRQGGYQLARPPERITLGEVVRATDGPLAPISCVSQTAYRPCTCNDETTCALRLTWLEVRAAIAQVLDNTTLAEVAKRSADLAAGQGDQFMYYI